MEVFVGLTRPAPGTPPLRITSARRSIASDPEYHERRPDAILTELW